MFINRMADAIIDRFGKDTILMPDGDNHFIVSVPVEVSEPFYAWVCSFGRRIRIVSPEPVVEEMKEFIGKSPECMKKGKKFDASCLLVIYDGEMFKDVAR